MCLSFALCFMVLTDILTKSLPTPQFAAFRETRGSGICVSFALVFGAVSYPYQVVADAAICSIPGD
jgi:hypothetical protein